MFAPKFLTAGIVCHHPQLHSTIDVLKLKFFFFPFFEKYFTAPTRYRGIWWRQFFSGILRAAVLENSRIRWLSNFSSFFQANLPSVQENTKKTIVESHIQIILKLLKGIEGSEYDESMQTFPLFNKLLLYSLCTAENESEILKVIMSADILHQNINEEENLEHVKDFQKTFVESVAIQIA